MSLQRKLLVHTTMCGPLNHAIALTRSLWADRFVGAMQRTELDIVSPYCHAKRLMGTIALAILAQEKGGRVFSRTIFNADALTGRHGGMEHTLSKQKTSKNGAETERKNKFGSTRCGACLG